MMPLKAQKGNMYEFVSHTWGPIKGKCKHDCDYCLVSGTKILMSDFSTKNIEDVVVSDTIIGLLKKDGKGFYRFDMGVVTAISKRRAKTIKIRTQDTRIECTPEHPIMGSTEVRNCSDWKRAKSFTPYENIRFVGLPSETNDDLLLGWLTGFCDGDGCFFNFKNKEGRQYAGFEAVCLNDDLRKFFVDTCNYFGIVMLEGYKQSSKKSFSGGNKNIMVHSRKSMNVKKLKSLVKFGRRELPEDFYKGYVAGMLDSDGSVSGSAIRISQSKIANKKKYGRIKFCLDKLDMEYSEEKQGFRLSSSFSVRAKILFDYKPHHSKKSQNLLKGFSVKGSEHSRIEEIGVGSERMVYNLETSCHNFVANGVIVHNCYMKKFPLKEIRLDEKELETNLGNGNFIFVGSGTDMFAADVPDGWIFKVLDCCKKYDNKYLFQSKDPARFSFFQARLPEKVVLGTTIETNRVYGESKAPSVNQRANAMAVLSKAGFETMVTIEPIFDFDLEPLVSLIKKIKPSWVNIGADSKGHKLPEPSKDKILLLIKELSKFTTVKNKKNLKRLGVV